MENVIEPLKFVYGAVDNKSPAFEMAHFMIENGQVRATNGVMSLGSPIDIDIKCAPHADTFMKAIRSCKDVLSLSVTPTGRLSVKSGKFKALVPCVDAEDCRYHPKPSGAAVEVAGDKILEAFTCLEPFVATDKLRPWANGVLLRGQSAFATNNICLIEAWLGAELPFTVNIPLEAVKAVIARKVAPSRVMLDERSITFFYDSGRWIKTQLYESKWPPLERVLEAECNLRPIPDEFFEGMAAVAKFIEDGRIYFRDGKVCSTTTEAEGATYEIAELPVAGLYHYEALKLLAGLATVADFDRYPEPAIFQGKNIRGAVLGMRQ